MTVMPSSSDVADKAVSTEDASSGAEVARMEAVLAALVENKVEAMKASSGARRAGSAPASPRRLRLTSESTVSSSQHHHHHGHHHQHHEFRNDKRGHRDKRGRHEHRHRRHGSAPCGDYIEDPVTHHHKQRHGKGKQKVPESPRSAKRRRQHSRSPHALSRGEIHPSAASGGIEHQDSAEQELSFINFDRATREALASDPPDLYLGAARLHQSACYISHSTAQIKNHYDDEDYLAFNYADELDEETFSGPAVLSSRPSGEFHKPRRKRRKRRRRTLIDVEGVEVELGVGPDDLPPQARWTIMATACLLLAMSLLLVGVTLRMAPIIDEMVRKENEELLNSLNRDSSVPENVTSLPP